MSTNALSRNLHSMRTENDWRIGWCTGETVFSDDDEGKYQAIWMWNKNHFFWLSEYIIESMSMMWLCVHQSVRCHYFQLKRKNRHCLFNFGVLWILKALLLRSKFCYFSLSPISIAFHVCASHTYAHLVPLARRLLHCLLYFAWLNPFSFFISSFSLDEKHHTENELIICIRFYFCG